MKDTLGQIHDDSLTSFYKIVDTTHQYYTISCDAWCYEWVGTNFITVKRKNEKEEFCYTTNNVGTHSSLRIDILGDLSNHRICLTQINQ